MHVPYTNSRSATGSGAATPGGRTSGRLTAGLLGRRGRSRLAAALTLTALTLAGGVRAATAGAAAAAGRTPYSVEFYQATDHSGHRLWCGSQHVLSAILDANGGFALRPHPGLDPNGWGSTWYLHAFLPGATLRGAVITAATADDDGWGLAVRGPVSAGANGTFGTWQADLRFSFSPADRHLTGQGTYHVSLSGPLSPATGDLNLQKIASNRLCGVRLLDGSTGDTGDTRQVVLSGTRREPLAAFGQTWVPGGAGYDNPYYPQDCLDVLCTAVAGEYNCVDTAATGRTAAIAAAYKPSLSVTLNSRADGLPLIFGAQFDTALAQSFEQDNVGLVVLVLNRATATAFTFDVTLDSAPPAGENVVVPSLAAGWNLLSVPFPVAFTLDEILRPGAGDLGLGTVWAWGAAVGRYARVGRQTRPTPGRGWWVYSLTGGSARCLAGPAAGRQLALEAGWNLVAPGAPGAPPSAPGLSPAWAWDPAVQVYVSLPPAEPAVPTRAYWLHADTACTVEW